MSRFACASTRLGLNGLLSASRRMLWAALALAVLGHLGLSQVRGIRQEMSAAKPLTTQFVKRRPRLTKPLELKKRPRPKSRRIERKMVAVKARTDRREVDARFQPTRVLGRLARPTPGIERFASFAATGREPHALAQRIAGAKETKEAVDMSLEMLDVEALDTGRHHAMVIQDPTDKRNVLGFFRLKYAYSQSMREQSYHDFENRILKDLNSLVEAVNRNTDIKATFEGRVSFDSGELLRTPWVFTQIGPYPFQMSLTDTEHLGRYLASGGFVFCEAHDMGAGYRAVASSRVPVQCDSYAHKRHRRSGAPSE